MCPHAASGQAVIISAAKTIRHGCPQHLIRVFSIRPRNIRQSYLDAFALHSWSHSGQASAIRALIFAMHSVQSSSTLGTLPNRSIISS
jgi:hypothetical protein